MTPKPLHTTAKLVYTAAALYALAIFTSMILQKYLPYEQAKRVEWWADLLAAIPLTVAIYGALAVIFIVPFALLYFIWFGGTKS